MSSQRVFKAEGVILKRKNVGEADRILTIFTKEYGKRRVIGKGIRKVSSRRSPHLEVFTRVQLVLHGSASLDRVSEVTPIAIYQDIRTDLTRVSIAYYLCELVDGLLPESQEHTDVYGLLTSSLDALSRADTDAIYKISKSFTLELLWLLGFLPRTKTLGGIKLRAFVESITERSLKSPQFARLLLKSSRA